jgi:hypothetical protein
MNNKPKIGEKIQLYGQTGKVIRVHAANTVDVRLADGNCYRITGLNYII